MDLWTPSILRNSSCGHRLKSNRPYKSKSLSCQKQCKRQSSVFEALIWKSVQIYRHRQRLRSLLALFKIELVQLAKAPFMMQRVGLTATVCRLHHIPSEHLLVILRWTALTKVKRTQEVQARLRWQWKLRDRGATSLKIQSIQSRWWLITLKYPRITARRWKICIRWKISILWNMSLYSVR